MSGIWQWMKAHPWLTAAILVGIGLLLILLLSGGSSEQKGSGPVYIGGDNASVQAGTALAAAQMNANTQALGINAQVQAQQDQNNTQLAIAALSARVQESNIMAGKEVALKQVEGQNLQTTAAMTIQALTLDSLVKRDKIQADFYDRLEMWKYGTTVTNNQTQQMILAGKDQMLLNMLALVQNRGAAA